MRATQARSSSSRAGVGQREHRPARGGPSQRGDRLGADALGRRVRRDAGRVLGLDGRAARRAARRTRRRRSPGRRGRSSGGCGAAIWARSSAAAARSATRVLPRALTRPRRRPARAAARGRSARGARCPRSSVRSKWIGVTAMRPVGDGGEVGSRLVVVVGRVAVDPVLAAARRRSSSSSSSSR